MPYRVRAPGSCGELVQGTIHGENFLVTCPIDLYAEARAEAGQGKRRECGPKAAAAVERTLAYLGAPSAEISVSVRSELHPGKGMASSSADISAACQAVALAFGRRLTEHEITDIALSIEPSDGIFFPGIMMLDHVYGRIRRPLGDPPPIYIAVFDAGGEVDTLNFNRRADLRELNAAKEATVREALDLVIRGLQKGDPGLIGRGATLSARANQGILPKPCLEEFIRIGEAFGAVGVNAAHSGTVLGILFPAAAAGGIDQCVAYAARSYRQVEFLRTVRLIPGGLEIMEVEEGDR